MISISYEMCPKEKLLRRQTIRNIMIDTGVQPEQGRNGDNDECAGAKRVYAPFGRAIAGRRDRVFIQMHFGAVYSEKGEYGWSRDLGAIKDTFRWELETLRTDYTDMGFLHCVDEDEDFDDMCSNGIFDYIKELKTKGVVRHISFSSHTPSLANRVLDTGMMDMMMFSINPAYDFGLGGVDNGTKDERAELFRRCQAEGVGISVMKPFLAGKLLSDKESQFGKALSHYQLIQYALDRPGVLTVVPGVSCMEHLDMLLGFPDAAEQEKDYSAIGIFTGKELAGSCVYCEHCLPCPAGIDIGLVNKYYDLALVGDDLAKSHYGKLSINASACMACGHCDARCPFGVCQSARMKEIETYFAVRATDGTGR